MPHKVMIVGTGKVGSSLSFALASQSSRVDELILTDLNPAYAEGDAMDLCDALAVTAQPLKVRAGTYASDAKSCDLIVIAAGTPQQKGQSRLELINENAAILKNIIDPIMQAGFNGIFLLASNPLDVMTQLAQRYSGLPHSQVIGSGTLLDSARLRHCLAEFLNLSPQSIHAYQVGEHGDSSFALWSQASAGAQPLSQLISPSDLEAIETYARNKAYSIINKKGATHYGIGACLARIIQAILADERCLLPVSSYDPAHACYYGFPSVVGRSGIIARAQPPLTPAETTKLTHSINTIKTALNSVQG